MQKLVVACHMYELLQEKMLYVAKCRKANVSYVGYYTFCDVRKLKKYNNTLAMRSVR